MVVPSAPPVEATLSQIFRAFLMFFVGMLHRQHGARPLVTAAFHGVTAAAVGLVAAVALQIGRKVLTRVDDLAFVALAVIGVSVLHQSVLIVLFVVSALAVWWYRPRDDAPGPPAR